jgi:hypothetical protein
MFSYIHAVIREPVAVHDTASTNFRYDQMSLATNHTWKKKLNVTCWVWTKIKTFIHKGLNQFHNNILYNTAPVAFFKFISLNKEMFSHQLSYQAGKQNDNGWRKKDTVEQSTCAFKPNSIG